MFSTSPRTLAFSSSENRYRRLIAFTATISPDPLLRAPYTAAYDPSPSTSVWFTS